MAHAPLSTVNPSAHAQPVMKVATAPRISTSVPTEATIVLPILFATTPTAATCAHAARDTRATAKLAALDALISTNVLSDHTTVARNLSASTITAVSTVPVATATSAIHQPSVVNVPNPSQAAKR